MCAATQRSAQFILVTGKPGTGKTTLISQVFSQLSKHSQILANGFLTEEVREAADRRGRRIGFDVVLLAEPRSRAPLARSADYQVAVPVPRNAPRVGQYVVDVQSFEQLAIPCIQTCLDQLSDTTIADGSRRNLTVCVIDEIGKMELLCPSFADRIAKLITRIGESKDAVLLATVPSPKQTANGRRGIPFVDQLCAHPQACMFEVTFSNRDRLVSQVYNTIIQRVQPC